MDGDKILSAAHAKLMEIRTRAAESARLATEMSTTVITAQARRSLKVAAADVARAAAEFDAFWSAYEML